MEPNNERISSKVFAAVIATGLMSFSGVLVETSMNIAFPTLMRILMFQPMLCNG